MILLLCLSLLLTPVRAEKAEKYVALTFDDGPSGRFTRRLLDGLAQRDVKATFFLCGYRLKDYPKEAQRIADEGHEIGFHGYSHDRLCDMEPDSILRELRDTAALLPKGVSVQFLRPPGGSCGSALCEIARQQGLSVLLWSLDTRDWAVQNTDAIVSGVLEQVQDGDVILMHDLYDTSVDAAFILIDALTAQGYHFVTASQLAALCNCTPQPGEVYTRFSAAPRRG